MQALRQDAGGAVEQGGGDDPADKVARPQRRQQVERRPKRQHDARAHDEADAADAAAGCQEQV
ncbi:hypothetical protein D3C87_1661300 [compost metagenome]